ncbi:MAG: DUF3106 domain-containing protein [Bacteriovoracia bacterium]
MKANDGKKKLSTWEPMDDELRSLLNKTQGRFARQPIERQAEAVALFQKFRERPPGEQSKLQDNLKDWQAMASEEKQQVESSYHDFQQLPEPAKAELRAKYARWLGLTEAEREKYRKK